jgi:hypothetical protein
MGSTPVQIKWKTIKLVFAYFSAKYAVLRKKTKDWLLQNHVIQKWLGGFSKQVSLHKNLFIDILKFPKLFLIKTTNFHVSVSLHLSPGVSSISIKCSSSGTLVSSGNSIKLISPCKNCPLINEKKPALDKESQINFNTALFLLIIQWNCCPLIIWYVDLHLPIQ